jgi:acid phosphatase
MLPGASNQEGGIALLARIGGVALAAFALLAAPAAAHHGRHGHHRSVKHIVVIYEENHSFDNLYGGWESVNGLRDARPSHTIQVDQNGKAYGCLLQDDVNLTSPPLSKRCSGTDATGTVFDSHFFNRPFTIDRYIKPTDKTCPPGNVFAPNGVLKDSAGALPGGCTRDIVHRFYQEQYQLDGGRQNRYVTGSDAVGLTMGHYRTRSLPVYEYLHSRRHPGYTIEDRFFQSAFGGSFFNHQWLIAAATPVYPGAPLDQHPLLDSNGMPTAYPLYKPTGPVNDSGTPLTQACGQPTTMPGFVCGDYAVNTIQPFYQPYSPGTAEVKRLPPQTNPTIGDRLSAKGIDWAWYSGGWSNADGDVGGPGWTNGNGPTCSDPNANPKSVYPNCPDNLFQFHHQPFNYYASYAPGTPGRAHLQDEQAFIDLAKSSGPRCDLKSVSFIKPIGAENEHPGYASEHTGSDHLVGLLRQIEGSGCRRNTMVIVTYDEFGGQWDHVSPPGQGSRTPGPHDRWGPGTRIPALVLAPGKRGFSVDHASHDTTSIDATIEHRFGLAPLSSRDARVNDLFTALRGRR